jgi:hypothetical protein
MAQERGAGVARLMATELGHAPIASLLWVRFR